MNDSYKILIVDDSEAIIRYLKEILKEGQDELYSARGKVDAKKIISQEDIDIMICDLMMPGMEDGLETMRFLKENQPDARVLGLSAHSSISNVVAVIKEGADDFVPKTSTRDQILQKIQELKQQVGNGNGNGHRNGGHNGNGNSNGNGNGNGNGKGQPEMLLIGQSAAIEEVREKIRVVAENEVETCLITGESGTGKELVARSIYRLSSRIKMPFIALNCAGMPDTLIDSELFGFERGSFTGAYQTSQGKFELASGGVLFLDEISEMPIHLQGKLLRVLENREVLRIGGKKPLPVDVMILAATNRNLEEEISQGTMREDIYYRLNLVKIEIPPLRERREDIPLLTGHFLQSVNTRL
ncbi:MAG: sigma-54 dependent transcriptional regulator, partial [Calditrichia bacterium]